MIGQIKRFFDRIKEQGVSAQKEHESNDILIATCVLLLEMAHIDGEFSESEKETIADILKRSFHLTGEFADTIIESSNEKLEESIDLWCFTNLINKHYSGEQKQQIIEMVWRIAYIDGKLTGHEDYLVHKIAALLHVNHKDLIDAKLRVLSSSGKNRVDT